MRGHSTDALFDELFDFCRSEFLSEDGLRDILEEHGCASNQSHVDRNYDFFIVACHNELVTEGILRCLIEYFPDAAGYTRLEGLLTPLQCICFNKHATRGMVQLIIDACPESPRRATSNGLTPLHILCSDDETLLDDDVAVDILGSLLDKCPEAARCANNNGYLPIHVAAGRRSKSLEFCRMLIEAYPGSERRATSGGHLPVHLACVRGAVATVEYLYKLYPESVNVVDEDGKYPIQCVFLNRNDVTLDIVQLLVDTCPEFPRIANSDGLTPLHILCANEELDDSTAFDVLGLFLERCPDAARCPMNYNAYLPIHAAVVSSKSVEFCRMLIEAYPGSERIFTSGGQLPLHIACRQGRVATVEYLYKLYPESINVADGTGWYPIHYAMTRLKSGNPAIAFEIVQFLLDCNPSLASQKFSGKFPLVVVCGIGEVASSTVRNVAVKILHLLFDAYPEAIEDNLIEAFFDGIPEEMQNFINAQRTYARLARDSTLMSTRDENGHLPLHRALCGNVTLGSIKLLVKGNRDAVRIPDNYGSLPLHLAVQSHDSTKVDDYLIGLDPNTLTAVDDWEGNTALHHACRILKYDTIALLLEKYGAVSVSKTNENNKLPIHLLLEWNAGANREDHTKYTESIFRLLRAYPDTVKI